MAVGVNIVSDFDAKGIKKAIADFKKLEGAGNKATFGLRTMDKAVTNGIKNLAKMGAVVGVVAGVVGKQLVDAASNLEESQSKVNVVFGASSKAVTDFASTAAKSMGISKQAALEATGTYGNLLQAFGVAQPQAVEMSTTLVQLAGDLASFNNTSVDEAITALRSGLSGETEPLKRFGVAINDVRLKQEALNMGLYSGKGNLDINAKTQAAYALILKDTSIAQGDYARTSDGVANTQKTLAAQFENLKGLLGTALVPMYKSLLSVVQGSILPVMTKFADLVGEEGLGAGLRMLGDGFLTAVSNGGKFVNTLLLLTTAFVAMRGVAIAATIAQNLFNVALLKNPIGLIVTAIYLLGVGLVAAYVKFEGFRKVVHAVVNASIAAWEFMTNAIIKGINFLIDAYNGLIKAANIFGAGLPQIAKIGEVSFRRIGNAANKASDKIFKTIDAIQAAKNAERRGGGLPTVSGSNDDIIGGGAGSGGGQSPIEKAKQALEKYIDAVKGLTSAQKSLRDANKSVNQSNETLLEKTKALTEAQRKFNLVTKGYGADSKEAKDADKERTKAERAAERAKYALEQAVFAVSEAEKDLAEIRKDPRATPKMIREAEIRLAESKLRVADATDEQVESSDALVASQNRLNEAVNGAKEGSDAYNEALKELADAEKDQRSAIDARTEAYERQAEAVEKLADAERDRIAAGKGVPKSDRAAVDASVSSVVAGVVAPVVDAIGRAIDVIPAPVAGGGFSQDELDGLGRIGRGDFSGIDLGLIRIPSLEELLGGGMGTLMANGGVVTRATSIIAGEAGAEAIIPLDRLGSFGSTYNIQVTAGMGADGKDIGTQIVNALKRYERTNGALPLTVQ
jgi:hypothetical protein